MKQKILLIDDDMINSLTVSKRIEKRGYEVMVLNDSTKYQAAIDDFKPDLMLLDIMMPEIGGLEILEETRKINDKNSLPIIMMTAKESPADIVETLSKGANDYLTKPINIEVAVARVKTQLDNVKLTKDSLAKTQLESVNALVVTYNHELNTPLTVAMGCVSLMKAGKTKDNTIEKLSLSLKYISDIVTKIKKVADEPQLNFDSYSNTSDVKMLKLS